MDEFIERHRDSVIGVLSGFDRVRFRGTLRWLCHADGLGRGLSTMKVLLKDFGSLTQRVTGGIRTAGCAGFDEDLALITAFNVANWNPGVSRTFTYTLTFHRPGDVDADGLIGASEFAAFRDCPRGPGVGPVGAACTTFDFECDDDVDQEDFAQFQELWGL